MGGVNPVPCHNNLRMRLWGILIHRGVVSVGVVRVMEKGPYYSEGTSPSGAGGCVMGQPVAGKKHKVQV